MPFRRILVPFDFSTLAEEGVRLAEQLAEVHGAHLEVLHVVEEPAFASFFKLGAMRIYGMVPDQEKVAWTALEKRFGDPGVNDRLDFHVVKGESDVQIIQFAKSHDIDLVVVTSHGLSGLDHVVMGNVAERVMKLAPCPVLVVKTLGPDAGGTANAERVQAGGSGTPA